MRIIASAALMLALASQAFAQTPLEPLQPPTRTTTPTPTVDILAAPPCEEITDAPAPPDGTTVSMRAMTASNEAYRVWRVRTEGVLECRRLHYNAAIDRMNAAATAWKTQVDAYCARRNVRCTQLDRGDVQVNPTR